MPRAASISSGVATIIPKRSPISALFAKRCFRSYVASNDAFAAIAAATIGASLTSTVPATMWTACFRRFDAIRQHGDECGEEWRCLRRFGSEVPIALFDHIRGDNQRAVPLEAVIDEDAGGASR